jgi:hypothetical protein
MTIYLNEYFDLLGLVLIPLVINQHHINIELTISLNGKNCSRGTM